MKNAEQPINPTTSWNGFEEVAHLGLTKREYFAGLAMHGLLANSTIHEQHTRDAIEWIADHAIRQADELLKQLEK